jgi:hypothetical protein
MGNLAVGVQDVYDEAWVRMREAAVAPLLDALRMLERPPKTRTA